MTPLWHEISLLFLQTPILPNPSNLRTLVKKASVISRNLSTRSKISVKAIRQSDRFYLNYKLKLNINILNSVESLNMVKVKIAKNHFKFEFLLMTRAEMNGLLSSALKISAPFPFKCHQKKAFKRCWKFYSQAKAVGYRNLTLNREIKYLDIMTYKYISQNWLLCLRVCYLGWTASKWWIKKFKFTFTLSYIHTH